MFTNAPGPDPADPKAARQQYQHYESDGERVIVFDDIGGFGEPFIQVAFEDVPFGRFGWLRDVNGGKGVQLQRKDPGTDGQRVGNKIKTVIDIGISAHVIQFGAFYHAYKVAVCIVFTQAYFQHHGGVACELHPFHLLCDKLQFSVVSIFRYVAPLVNVHIYRDLFFMFCELEESLFCKSRDVRRVLLGGGEVQSENSLIYRVPGAHKEQQDRQTDDADKSGNIV